MEFRDLKRQYQALKPKVDSAVFSVFENADFISGAMVSALENRLAAYVGRKHCISCANGTDALELMLKVFNIGAGDAIFVPNFTFFASGEVVCSAGAIPVFVEVREDTFNMDAEKLETAIVAVQKKGLLKPKAVIAVDLFGQTADYVAIEEVTQKYGLLLFEDAAQGFGAMQRNRRACAFGDMATTSFFPAKPLGCYGDGGAIFTDDDEKAALLRSLVVHGKGSNKYDNIRIGCNSRLDTIQAAVLMVKMDAMEDYELDAVNRVANDYTTRLKALVKTPCTPEGMYQSWAQYTILLQNETERNEAAEFLKSVGIPTMVYYPVVMRAQKAFEGYEEHQVDHSSVSSFLTKCVLSLPMHPYLAREEIKSVCCALEQALAKHRK